MRDKREDIYRYNNIIHPSIELTFGQPHTHTHTLRERNNII